MIPQTIITYKGKQYTPFEFQEFIAHELPDAHKRAVQSSIRIINTSLQSIEMSRENIRLALRTLQLLAATEPLVQPLSEYLKAEVQSLR